MNFTKPKTMYKAGMKVCVLSNKRGDYWEKEGDDIKYFKTAYRRKAWKKPTNLQQQESDSDDLEEFEIDAGNSRRKYYGLEFSYTFQFDGDTVYFAYSLPYTYTQILKSIHTSEANLIEQGAEAKAARRQSVIKKKKTLQNELNEITKEK